MPKDKRNKRNLFEQKLRRFLNEQVEVEPEVEPDIEIEPESPPTVEPEEPKPGRQPFRPPKIEPGTEPKPKATKMISLHKESTTKEHRIYRLYKILQEEIGDKENLLEVPIDYDDVPERMHPDVEKKLKTREHPLGDLPMYPKGTKEQNFEELIASKRFKEVVEKLKRYTGRTEPIESLIELQETLIEALNKVIEIEEKHQEELEHLAAKLIQTEFGFSPQDIGLQVKLRGREEIDLSDIPDVADDKEDVEHLSGYKEEIQKRRFLNSLIHGAAVKTTYAYYLVKEELDKIDPQLVNLYSILSSFSEFGYWVTPDAMATASKKTAAVGKSKVDLSKDKPIVIAYATTFPFLVHELAKGVMEVLSAHGLPRDPRVRKHVISKADFMDAEHWDLRLGPGMWERFVNMVDEDEADIRSHLYTRIAAMPTSEFNALMKELLAGTDKGKKQLKRLALEIRRDIQS